MVGRGSFAVLRPSHPTAAPGASATQDDSVDDSGARIIDDGIDGLSNAPPGERWPKVDRGVERMKAALESGGDAQVVAESMLGFLATSGDTSIESTPFVIGEQYGTRSSTVIVVTPAGDVLFIEQNWLRGGVRDGAARTVRFRIERA